MPRFKQLLLLTSAKPLSRLIAPMAAMMLIAPYVFAASQARPLDLQTSLATKVFGDRTPLALSPDGSLLAFTVVDPKRRTMASGYLSATGVPTSAVGGDILLSDTSRGTTRNLTQGNGSSWDPVWSPNGRWLAFYSDREGRAQVWLWDRSRDRLRVVNQDEIRVFFGFETLQWLPDSTALIAKVLRPNMDGQDSPLNSASPPSSASSPDKAHVIVFRSDQPLIQATGNAGFLNINRCDLALLPIDSQPPHRLSADLRIRGVWISPNSDYVAVTVFRGFGSDGGYDLRLIPLGSTEPITVATKLSMEYGTSMSWSPHGDELAFTANGDISVFHLHDHSVQKLTTGTRAPLDALYRAPVWSNDGRFVYALAGKQLMRCALSSGGCETILQSEVRIDEFVGAQPGRFSSFGSDTMMLEVRDTGARESGFVAVNLTTGGTKKILLEPKQYGSSEERLFEMTATKDGHFIYYTAEDAAHPPEIWRLDTGRREASRLTQLNPQLDPFTFGKTQLVSYQDSNGNPLHATLLLPADYQAGVHYPMITWVYGDAYGSSALEQFGLDGSGIDNMQLFSTRGYAVLYPDAPLRVGSPLDDLVSTVVPAVKRVIDMGIADPARIGIMGQSYGGYSVLALLTRTPIFKAAVARSAEADLIGQYLSFRDATGDAVGISWAEEGQGKMGGSLWQYPNRYIANSPIFSFDKITTPLLLLHGGQDPTVPSYLGDQVFVALRRLGKDVTYAKYPDEGHWEGEWKYGDMEDALTRIVEFFEKRLKSEQITP